MRSFSVRKYVNRLFTKRNDMVALDSTGESKDCKKTIHRDAVTVECPSCKNYGLSDVHDELGKLHAVTVLIILSIFTGQAYQFRNNRLPYGFERNHYCRHCGCYIGTSGKVKSVW